MLWYHKQHICSTTVKHFFLNMKKYKIYLEFTMNTIAFLKPQMSPSMLTEWCTRLIPFLKFCHGNIIIFCLQKKKMHLNTYRNIIPY